MQIQELLKIGIEKLKQKNIEEPQLKCRLLMQYILKQPRQYLVINSEKSVNEEQKKEFLKYIEDLLNNVPLQHITHSQEFMKMKFYVDENVLIPRPDTEILVEETIKIATNKKSNNNIKILDLCTGSGAIAISLAKYIKNSQITAIDISSKALEIAKKNAKINQVNSQITFIKSDLFAEIKNEKYDIIVSNPPYIKTEVINLLDKQVQREPKIALDGGKSGLDFYEKIIANRLQIFK